MMPRPLRIEYENAWYHVMNRGADQRAIYQQRKHYEVFLQTLREATELFDIECHGYCLMSNHYHLLIKTPKANLSRAMRHINGVYTQRYNNLQKSDGPLFRGRYKSIIIDADNYLLQVSRYIHLNPVKARMETNAGQYSWSSCQYYLGIKKSPAWLKSNVILRMLSTRKNHSEYFRFLSNGVDQPTFDFYNKKKMSVIMGNKLFKEKLLKGISPTRQQATSPDYNATKLRPNMDIVCRVCAEFFKIKEQELYSIKRGIKNLPRKIAIYGCRQWSSEKCSLISEKFNFNSLSTVTNISNEIKYKINNDSSFQSILDKLEKKVYRTVN